MSPAIFCLCHVDRPKSCGSAIGHFLSSTPLRIITESRPKTNNGWLASQTTMSDRVLAIIALISVIADHYLRQRGQVGDNPAWPFAPPAR